MPVIIGTPESVLPRSDSKNPATTCKGLTSNGRPCRRSLASPRTGNQGILAVLPYASGGHSHGSAAAFFCWQHKDQASNLTNESTQILELKQRSSIETLVEKLGVLDIDETNRRTSRNSKQNVVKRETLPQRWDGISGPLISVPEDPFGPGPTKIPAAKPRPVRKRKDEIHVSLFCCMKGSKEESLPPARPRPATATAPVSAIPYQTSLQAMPNSLESHLSFIPQALPTDTRKTLITEISRPLTNADHEPGYIYIFWLTPKGVPREAARAASSLLVPPTHDNATSHGRRTSDVLREYNNNSAIRSGLSQKIMLKIGRATNVHRRMVQWSQQCGHHITLLRYYPHHNRSSAVPSPQTSPRASSRNTPTANNAKRELSPSPTQKAPFIPRVERLIHLELADKRVIRDCEGCGKEHREWFEVDATRQGIREIDAVVRRWIDWAQRQ